MFRSNSITDFKLRAKKVVSRRRSRSHGEGDLDEYGPLIQQIHSKICPVEKVSDKKIEEKASVTSCEPAILLIIWKTQYVPSCEPTIL